MYQNDSQQLPVIWTTEEASDETDADDDNHLQKKSCNEKLMKSTEIRCNNHVHAMAKTTKKCMKKTPAWKPDAYTQFWKKIMNERQQSRYWSASLAGGRMTYITWVSSSSSSSSHFRQSPRHWLNKKRIGDGLNFLCSLSWFMNSEWLGIVLGWL